MAPPVLIIGLDAGTPDLLERWMADGFWLSAIERVARMRSDDDGPPERCPDVVATFRGHQPPLLELDHPSATIQQPKPWWDARNGHSARGVVVGAGPETIRCLDFAPAVRSTLSVSPA